MQPGGRQAQITGTKYVRLRFNLPGNWNRTTREENSVYFAAGLRNYNSPVGEFHFFAGFWFKLFKRERLPSRTLTSRTEQEDSRASVESHTDCQLINDFKALVSSWQLAQEFTVWDPRGSTLLYHTEVRLWFNCEKPRLTSEFSVIGASCYYNWNNLQ